MTGTDAMDAHLTGGRSIDQQRAALKSPPPPPPPPPPRTYLYLPPQLLVTTQRKHNNHHQNSHHDELAPQQEYLGKGWEEIRKNVARVVVALLPGACGPRVEKNNVCVGPAPFAQSAVWESLHIQPRRDLAAGNKKYLVYIYIFTSPFSRGKKNTVPPRRRKIKLPSRPVPP